MKPHVIALAHGGYFDFNNPGGSSVSIEDIAHALSNLCRFTGHTKCFYSVAQHSVFVARILPPHLKIPGLLHDAAEAVLGDLSTPLKQMLPAYRDLERIVEKNILRQLGYDQWLDNEIFIQEVKNADLRMLKTERVRLLPPGGEEHWAWLKNYSTHELTDAWEPAKAKEEFLNAWHRYRKAEGK